jgi:hypothetical protein
MAILPDLHDSIFVGVNFDWDRATAWLTFELRQADGVQELSPLVIEASGLTDLKCPRKLPWGPSVYVNSADLESFEGSERLAVEMLSGDVIEVHCREASIKGGRST